MRACWEVILLIYVVMCWIQGMLDFFGESIDYFQLLIGCSSSLMQIIPLIPPWFRFLKETCEISTAGLKRLILAYAFHHQMELGLVLMHVQMFSFLFNYVLRNHPACISAVRFNVKLTVHTHLFWVVRSLALESSIYHQVLMFTMMAVEQQALQFIIWMSILAPVTFLQIDPCCQGNIPCRLFSCCKRTF